MEIYRDFSTSRDAALMREFHRGSWPARAEIAGQFEDDRYRKITRGIIFSERPDLLDDETHRAFSAVIAQRWPTQGKAKWLTLERAMEEIEERREAASFGEAILLEDMKSYFRQKRELAEGWAAR